MKLSIAVLLAVCSAVQGYTGLCKDGDLGDFCQPSLLQISATVVDDSDQDSKLHTALEHAVEDTKTKLVSALPLPKVLLQEVQIPGVPPPELQLPDKLLATLGSERPLEPGSWRLAYSFVSLIILYAGLCIVYSCVTAKSTSEEPLESLAATKAVKAKPRYEEWDFIRFVLHFCIVSAHLVYYTFIDGKHFGNVFKPWWHVTIGWSAGFKMSAFAFLSGVFGQSISRNALGRMMCYTFGTALLSTMLQTLFTIIAHGMHVWTDVLPFPFMSVTWYLWSLAVWRLVVSPLFYIASTWNIHVAVPYVATCLLSYVAWHAISYMVADTLEKISTQPMYFSTFTLAPFFALGHLMPTSRWNTLIQDPRYVSVATVFAVAWYSGLALSPAFRQWNQVATLGRCSVIKLRGFSVEALEEAQGQMMDSFCLNDQHFPNQYSYASGEFTLNMVQVDVLNFGLKVSITLAMIFAITAPLHLLKRLAPSLTAVIVRSGTRTLYGYILHWLIMVDLARLMDFRLILEQIPDAYIPVCSQVFSLFTVFIFTSTLTERLCSWFIMPFWLMDIFSCTKTEDNKAPASQSALLGETESGGEKAFIKSAN